MAATALLAVLALGPATRSSALNTSSWQWYKTDLHVHSVVSGDALADVGVISNAAKPKGYNAMFITDHQAASNFPISTVIANHVSFADSFGSKWEQTTFGSLSATASALVTTPVKSGTSSLHLKSTSSTFGETFVDLKRGPNLRSGDLIFKVSIYPTTLGAGSGLYVSVALGGDPSVQAPEGYTTQGDVISSGKSTILVWQCGAARMPSSSANARVLVSTLSSCTLNTWNDYVINITQGTVTRNGGASSTVLGIKDIPAADMPLDYNATTWIKMSAAASNGGTAEGYFDALNLDASNAVPSGDEFAFRNSAITAYDTSTYKDFPSIEMGYNRHAQRFNFGLTSGLDYKNFFQCTDTLMTQCTIDQGIEGILPTQQTGYPAQLNHPNLPGGVKLSEIQADNYQAFGADVMEVRPDAGGVPPTTMVDIWDTMLQGGLVIIGSWSSDMHSVFTLDDPSRGVATYIFAPSLSFDALMRSLYEGRAYLARNTFSGRVLFNLSSAAQEPYPARYPVYVSSAATTASVHLNITTGIASSSTVRWLVNGSEIANEAATSSYNTVKSISLAGARTYVRAELHNGSPPINYIAMTEPIFFIDVSSLPVGMSYHIDGIDTPDGRSYTKIGTKGITSTSYNSTSNILSLTLTNPVNSLTELEVATAGRSPSQVNVNGATVAAATSQSAFDAATDSSWFYDGTANVLHVKAKQVIGDTPVVVNFGPPGTDTTPPTKPTNVVATAISSTRVDLSWTASTDNSGTIDRYDIYRGVGVVTPTFLQTVGATPTTASDVTAAASTTYTYCIVASDPAGNSSESPPGTACAPPVTTPAGGGGGSATFNPVADAYVRSDLPTTNNGTVTTLRTDASPIIRSYLRFNVSASGTITQAVLKLTSTSTGAGYKVHGGVTNNAWGETTINYANAPTFASLSGDPGTGSFASGAVTSVDVTPFVTGSGLVTLVVDTTSTTAMAFSSREATTTTARPQLVVTTSGGGGDTQPPSVPGGVAATPASSTQINVSWSASTDNSGTVSGYHVYDGGASVGTVTSGTSFQHTGLAPGSSHSYTVDAFDPSGNTSLQSSPAVSASTPPDTQAPSKPTNVNATAPDSAHVNLTWTASTDNVAVTGYDIYRNASLLTTLTNGAVTSYTDGTVLASTSYTFCLVAFDAAGNHSETPPGTACAPVTTPAGGGGGTTLTFMPVADTYVRSDTPTVTNGSSTSLRVDTSPTITSYLRFNVTGLSGTVTSVTLRVFANSSLSTGYDVAPVSDNIWSEALTYPGPTFGTVAGTSTAAVAGSWTTVTLTTSFVAGNGLISLALVGRSTTALNLASREDLTHQPQLIVTAS